MFTQYNNETGEQQLFSAKTSHNAPITDKIRVWNGTFWEDSSLSLVAPVIGACIVQASADKLVMFGGWGINWKNRHAFIYSNKKETWTNIGFIPHTRNGQCGCALLPSRKV